MRDIEKDKDTLKRIAKKDYPLDAIFIAQHWIVQFEAAQAEIERLRRIRLNATEAHTYVQTKLVEKIEQLKADNAALMAILVEDFSRLDESMFYSPSNLLANHVIQVSRECLSKIGGAPE